MSATQQFYQSCPVCNGAGMVSRPPNTAGDVPTWTGSSTLAYPCRVCAGRGVIPTPSGEERMDRAEQQAAEGDSITLAEFAESNDPALRLREAEAYIAELRGPLLWYFGTTDPDLLAEVWADAAGARSADEVAPSPDETIQRVRPLEIENA